MATCSLIIHLARGRTRDELITAVSDEPRLTIGPAHQGRVAAVLQTDSPRDDEAVGSWLADQPPVGWIDWVGIRYDDDHDLSSADFARRRRSPVPITESTP